MQNRFGLLDMDVMPIFMIIALDIVITLRFSINCSIVICLHTVCVLSREKPLVKTMAAGSISHHLFSDIQNQKYQKYLDAFYLYLLYFSLLLIFCTYLYQISLLLVAVKGLTTPFSRCVQVFVSLCRCIVWRLACASY